MCTGRADRGDEQENRDGGEQERRLSCVLHHPNSLDRSQAGLDPWQGAGTGSALDRSPIQFRCGLDHKPGFGKWSSTHRPWTRNRWQPTSPRAQLVLLAPNGLPDQTSRTTGAGCKPASGWVVPVMRDFTQPARTTGPGVVADGPVGVATVLVIDP